MELIKALPFREPPPPLSPEQQRQRQTMLIAEDNRGGDDNNSRKSSATREFERQTYVKLKTREELGFYDSDYRHVAADVTSGEDDEDDDEEIDEADVDYFR